MIEHEADNGGLLEELLIIIGETTIVVRPLRMEAISFLILRAAAYGQ